MLRTWSPNCYHKLGLSFESLLKKAGDRKHTDDNIATGITDPLFQFLEKIAIRRNEESQWPDAKTSRNLEVEQKFILKLRTLYQHS